MKWISLAALVAAVGCDAHAAPAHPPSFRLMTYNVEFDNPDRKATIDAIAAADADVVVLQEITQQWQDDLTARLGDRYAHRLFHLHARQAGGLAILSRLPLDNDEVFDSPNPGWFPAERVTLRAPFGDVQLVSVHLRPAIDRHGWVSGFLSTPPLRLAEATAYRKRLARDVATIVAGDFNEGPGGDAVQHLIDGGLARAPAVGPPTWHYVGNGNTDLLTFDLDHILVGKLVAHDPRVLDAGTSDHRPVVATITAP
jgi:endonuclease/exonuclease/phosphatase (EEP) superfamily protein YafD